MPVAAPAQNSEDILVENISASANRLDIVALFDTNIGKVRKSEGVNDGAGMPLKISFFTPDAFQKALCMSGYIFAGRPLFVRAASRRSQEGQNLSKQTESRRNLYVLGLPFTLTKSEFVALFSRFGTVCHCVILATLDNASRRRGFVVMSSNDEAKLAMNVLSRSQLKGHTLDISWAVVQRSQGFLDGGDRRLMFDQPPAQITPDANGVGGPVATRLIADAPIAPGLLSSGNESRILSQTPTSTLLVGNLPVFLFSQTTDLHPLLLPFGKIHKLEILPAVPGQSQDAIRVVVEYSSTSSAKEAKETIQGQKYSHQSVVVEYLVAEPTSPQVQDEDAHGTITSSLNPFAPAFVSETSLQPSLAIPLVYRSASSLSNALPSQGNTPIGSQYPFSNGLSSKLSQEQTQIHTRQGLGLNAIDVNDACIRPASPKFPALRGSCAFSNLSNAMNVDYSLHTRGLMHAKRS